MPWDEIYYWATVVFHRTHKQFLKMTPVQLNSLIDMHILANDPEAKGNRSARGNRGNTHHVEPENAAAVLAALSKQRLAPR